LSRLKEGDEAASVILFSHYYYLNVINTQYPSKRGREVCVGNDTKETPETGHG
jgi:hypothetical protein